MNPRPAAIAAFLLAGALAVTAGPASAAAPSSPCAAKRSVTIAKGDGVRVYRVRKTASVGTDLGFRFFACRTSTGKQYLLARTSPTPRGQAGDEIGVIRVSGNWVAAGIATNNGYGERARAYIRRIDLATGRTTVVDLCKNTECPSNGSNGPRYDTAVQDLDLQSGGRMAWIVKYERLGTFGDTPALRYDVGRLDSRGAGVLDSGPDVDPRSLATGASRVYWMRGGKPSSSDLV